MKFWTKFSTWKCEILNEILHEIKFFCKKNIFLKDGKHIFPFRLRSTIKKFHPKSKKKLKWKQQLDILIFTGKNIKKKRNKIFIIFGSFDESCFYNSDYMAARGKLATNNGDKSDSIDSIDL